jgi:proteasome lid subunit RPN8/RPN11
MMHLIEGKLRRDLLVRAFEATPYEAVGLILPDRRVVSLPNLAEGDSTFRVSKADIIAALEGVERQYLDEVVLWHSHPSGGIGPSTTDLQQKTQFTYHLVVSIVDGDIVPTWY